MEGIVVAIGAFFARAEVVPTVGEADSVVVGKVQEKTQFGGSTREEFVSGIVALYIGEWKERYENLYVLDGTQWSISIEYEDGTEPFEIYGSNAYPYNFEDLIDFLGIDNSDTDEMGDDHDE